MSARVYLGGREVPATGVHVNVGGASRDVAAEIHDVAEHLAELDGLVDVAAATTRQFTTTLILSREAFRLLWAAMVRCPSCRGPAPPRGRCRRCVARS